MGKKKKKDMKKAAKIFGELLQNDDVMKKVLGTYSDGTIRNLSDSLRGEFLSPKQKKEAEKTKKKLKKKKKKAKERKELMSDFFKE